MEKQMIWYEVHRQYEDGKIEWTTYVDRGGYSKHYRNDLRYDMRYDLEDARAVAKEIMEKYPGEKWVVIEVSLGTKLV